MKREPAVHESYRANIESAVHGIRKAQYESLLLELKDLHAEDTITDDMIPDIISDPDVFPDIRDEVTATPDGDPIPSIRPIQVNRAERTLSQERYELLKPCFLYRSKQTIEKTLSITTQYYKSILAGPHIYHTTKARFPAVNVKRRHKPVATDTVFAMVPAVDTGGVKATQLFVGRTSKFVEFCPVKSTAEFVNTLEDTIRKYGAIDKLISDSARVEISERVKDILRRYMIEDW